MKALENKGKNEDYTRRRSGTHSDTQWDACKHKGDTGHTMLRNVTHSVTQVSPICYPDSLDGMEDRPGMEGAAIPSLADVPSISAQLPIVVTRAIERTQPKRGVSYRRALFNYARALKAIPNLGENLEPYAFGWYRAMKLPGDRLPELVHQDLEVMFAAVDDGDGGGLVVVACERARKRPHPECTLGMSDRLRVLAGICRELQIVTVSDPFWLSCRDVGKIFNMSYSFGNEYLNVLVKYNILQIVETGQLKGRKATTYFYLPDPME